MPFHRQPVFKVLIDRVKEVFQGSAFSRTETMSEYLTAGFSTLR